MFQIHIFPNSRTRNLISDFQAICKVHMHDTSVRCTASGGAGREEHNKKDAKPKPKPVRVRIPWATLFICRAHKTAQNCHVSVETRKGHSLVLSLSLSISLFVCLSLSKHAKVRKFLALNNECNMQNTLRRRGCKSNEICKFSAYTQSQRNDRQ